MAIEPIPITSRGPDHATSTTSEYTTSPKLPVSNTKELVSNTSEANLGGERLKHADNAYWEVGSLATHDGKLLLLDPPRIYFHLSILIGIIASIE